MAINNYIDSHWNFEYLDTSWITNKHLDVSYYCRDGIEGLLDLYLPESSAPVPLIIVVSGGGWFFGEKSTKHLGSVLEVAIREGFAVVSFACTGSGQKKFPYQIYEIKAAVRYLRFHAAEYGLNPNAFSFWSPSSGAHLSLMAALTFEDEEFDAPVLGYSGISSEVQAVVATYPITEIGASDEQFRELGIEPLYPTLGINCNEGVFLGAAPEEDPELAKKASPIYYITPNSPAIYLQHGRQDHTVPVLQSVTFYDKYCEIVGSDRIRMQIIDDADHSDPRFKEPGICHEICEFLREMTNA